MGKAEETKNYIIEHAAPLFNMYGYAGTSMNRLTQAINKTKGAIYRNYKDKDEIALAASDYSFVKICKKIANVIRSRRTNTFEQTDCICQFLFERVWGAVTEKRWMSPAECRY